MFSIIYTVTSPLHESRLLWIHDPHRNQPSHVPPSHPPASRKTNPVPRTNNTVPRTNNTVPRINDTVPRSNNKVPRNRNNVPRNGPIPQSSDVRVRAPLENISRSVWHNSALSSRSNNCPPVPRNNVTDRQTDAQKTVSPPPKKKRINYKRREQRARGRREGVEAFNHDVRWATQSSGAPSSTLVPDRVTQSDPQVSDPISAMRPAVYYPHESVGNPTANDNSSLQFDQELGESAGLLPGLYKPAIPDPQHHTWANSSAATSAKTGPPSPTSEQRRRQDQDRDYLPPSATQQTS